MPSTSCSSDYMDRQTRLYMVYVATTFFFTIFFLSGIYFDIPTPSKYVDTRVVYQYVPEYINTTIEVPVGEIYEKNATVYGIAVFNETGSGELARITMLLRPGYGGTFVDVSEKTFGADLQESMPLIRSYAQAFTQTNLAYKDLVVKIEFTGKSVQGT